MLGRCKVQALKQFSTNSPPDWQNRQILTVATPPQESRACDFAALDFGRALDRLFHSFLWKRNGMLNRKREAARDGVARPRLLWCSRSRFTPVVVLNVGDRLR